MRGKATEGGDEGHEFADVIPREREEYVSRLCAWMHGRRDLLGNVALFLRRLVAAIVVGHADAGWAVGLANDFNHMCWGAWIGLLASRSFCLEPLSAPHHDRGSTHR